MKIIHVVNLSLILSMGLFAMQTNASLSEVMLREKVQQKAQQMQNRMQKVKETFKQGLGNWNATMTAEDIQYDNGHQQLSKLKQKQGCDVFQTTINELDSIFSDLKHFYVQNGIQREGLPDRQEIIKDFLRKLNDPNSELSNLELRCSFQ